MVDLWSICGQFVVNLWSICGQIVVNLWSICGQFVVDLWSICGHFVVNYRSKGIQYGTNSAAYRPIHPSHNPKKLFSIPKTPKHGSSLPSARGLSYRGHAGLLMQQVPESLSCRMIPAETMKMQQRRVGWLLLGSNNQGDTIHKQTELLFWCNRVHDLFILAVIPTVSPRVSCSL